MTMHMDDRMLDGLMGGRSRLGESGEITKTDDMDGITGFGAKEVERDHTFARVDGDSLAMTGTECSFDADKRDLAMVGGDN